MPRAFLVVKKKQPLQQQQPKPISEPAPVLCGRKRSRTDSGVSDASCHHTAPASDETLYPSRICCDADDDRCAYSSSPYSDEPFSPATSELREARASLDDPPTCSMQGKTAHVACDIDGQRWPLVGPIYLLNPSILGVKAKICGGQTKRAINGGCTDESGDKWKG